jgi:hypothetical protein
MKPVWLSALYALCLLTVGAHSAVNDADWSGRWEVKTTYPGGSYVAGLDLSLQQNRVTGRSGWLVPDWANFYYEGIRQDRDLRLKIVYKDGSPIGDLTLKTHRGVLNGAGNIHGVAVTLVGHRPQKRPAGAATVHTFEPKVYYRIFRAPTAGPLLVPC